MRCAAFVSVVVIGVLASGCKEPNTTSYDPVGVAAADANMELEAVPPPEQVTSCVESTKFGAYVGDATAQARWDAAGQSEGALSDVCSQLGRIDPAALAIIHWNWTAAQSSIDAAPAAAAAPVADCDPSYPDLCLPIGGPDVDCGDVDERRFAVLAPDRHGFDDDHDGVGCESD